MAFQPTRSERAGDGIDFQANPVAGLAGGGCLRDLSLDRLLRSMMDLPLEAPLPAGNTRSSTWLDFGPQTGADRFTTPMLSDPCTQFGTSHQAWLVIDLVSVPAVIGPVTIPATLRGGGADSHFWRGCPASVSAHATGLSGSGLIARSPWVDFDPTGQFWVAPPLRLAI